MNFGVKNPLALRQRAIRLLTGDAAFVPRPHTAGSTAKAAANALALVEAVDGKVSLDEALVLWQRQALQEGAKMSEWGIQLGNRIMGIDTEEPRDLRSA